MTDNEVNILQDKDKLMVVVNVYVNDNRPKQDNAAHFVQVCNHYKQMFDDSVKVIVIPVFDKQMQKIELLNVKGCDDELVKKMNENFENFIEFLSK